MNLYDPPLVYPEGEEKRTTPNIFPRLIIRESRYSYAGKVIGALVLLSRLHRIERALPKVEGNVRLCKKSFEKSMFIPYSTRSPLHVSSQRSEVGRTAHGNQQFLKHEYTPMWCV